MFLQGVQGFCKKGQTWKPRGLHPVHLVAMVTLFVLRPWPVEVKTRRDSPEEEREVSMGIYQVHIWDSNGVQVVKGVLDGVKELFSTLGKSPRKIIIEINNRKNKYAFQ